VRGDGSAARGNFGASAGGHGAKQLPSPAAQARGEEGNVGWGGWFTGEYAHKPS